MYNGYMSKYHEFEETSEPIELKVSTRRPQKWLLIDRETGVVYEGNDKGAWDRLDPVKPRYTRIINGIG